MSNLQIWTLAARPKTLWAALTPVLIGTVLARADDAFSLWPALAAAWGAIWIQIGTNFANDYYDFKSGADRGERLGPLRVTQAGLVAPAAMKLATLIAFGLAFVAGLYLVWHAGWPIAIIGLASILFGILYTGGPYPLGYNGLGEAFVLVFFGPVAVAGTYYVQTLQIGIVPILAGLGPGWLSVAMLAVNNLRDLDNDRACGKRTLAARFGRPFARAEYLAAVYLAALTPVLLYLINPARPWSLITLVLPVLAVSTARTVLTRTDGSALNGVLATTGQLMLAYAALFSIGWLL